VATFDLDADDRAIPRGFTIINRDLTGDSATGMRFDFVETAGGTARGGTFMFAKEQTYTTLASTKDAFFTLMVSSNGVLQERLHITSGGLIGVNQASPTARLDVLESTLGNVVLRLATTATNDDPALEVSQQWVTTTNATPTTLATIPITASNTYYIRAVVIARRTGGASGTADDGGAFVDAAAYTTKAGVVTMLLPAAGAPEIENIVRRDVAGLDCALVISGTNILVQVTGIASTNYTWHLVKLEVAKVGT
jgi:hypothetical protein